MGKEKEDQPREGAVGNSALGATETSHGKGNPWSYLATTPLSEGDSQGLLLAVVQR